MRLLDGKLIVELESFLDIPALDSISEKVNFAIAKNHDKILPSFGQEQTALHQDSILFYEEEKRRLELTNIKFADKKTEDVYLKLQGASTLGSHLNLTQGGSFFTKHDPKLATHRSFANDFKCLFDWIDAQRCFKEYARVIFFFSEAGQVGTLHRDYPSWLRWNPDVVPSPPVDKYPPKDMFLWISSTANKRLFVYNEDTQERQYTQTRAATFHNYNYHGTENQGNNYAWSLRIDGTFTKEWAEKVGVYTFFQKQIDNLPG